MKVRFKKLNDKAVIPTKAHSTDAGFDLTATSCYYGAEIDDGNITYGTGIAVEIPEGYVGLVFPRSSISKKEIALTNSVGVIDSSYRGEIFCKFKPTLRHNGNMYGDWTDYNSEPNNYSVGDRIAQLIILPYPEIEFEEAAELSSTERGAGGYGSTGR